MKLVLFEQKYSLLWYFEIKRIKFPVQYQCIRKRWTAVLFYVVTLVWLHFFLVKLLCKLTEKFRRKGKLRRAAALEQFSLWYSIRRNEEYKYRTCIFGWWNFRKLCIGGFTMKYLWFNANLKQIKNGFQNTTEYFSMNKDFFKFNE